MKKKELLRGSLDLLILKIIDQKGESYGYEIQQELKTSSDGEMEITYGSLYPALHKLKADGMITTREDTSGSRKRIYYQLTGDGEQAIESWTDEWVDFFKFMVQSLDINPQVVFS